MDLLGFIRGIGLNPKGTRNLTRKEKEKLKQEYRKNTGKKTSSKLLEVDHKKPVALYKKPWWKDQNFVRLEQRTKFGRLRKHSYDNKNNLQVLHKKAHKKKTKEDMIKIKEKRRKEMQELGIGFTKKDIIGENPFKYH